MQRSKYVRRNSNTQTRVDAEAAARFLSERAGLHVSGRTVLAWARSGRIPHLRLVGRVAFNLAELEQWLLASTRGLSVDLVPEIQAGAVRMS